MSASKFLPHLVVVPEDDANRQLMNGFKQNLGVKSGQIQIEAVAKGWRNVPKYFLDNLASTMNRFDKRFVLLLVDFDGKGEGRFNEVVAQIPEKLRNRVFVIGTSIEPERFSKDEGRTLEELGQELARECLDGEVKIWGSDHLKHNLTELEQMKRVICNHLKT